MDSTKPANTSKQAYYKLEKQAFEANKNEYGNKKEFQNRGREVYRIINADISQKDIEKTARGYAMNAIDEWKEKRRDDEFEAKRTKYNKKHGEDLSPAEFEEYLNNTRLHKVDQALSKTPILNLGYGLVKGLVNLPKTTIDTVAHTVQLNHYNKTAKEAIEKTGNLAAAKVAIDKINQFDEANKNKTDRDKFDREKIVNEVTQEKLNDNINEGIIGRVKNASKYGEYNEDTGVSNLRTLKGQKSFGKLRNEDEENLSADDQIRKIFGNYAVNAARKKATTRVQQNVINEIERINKQNPNTSTVNNYKEIVKQINKDIGGALQQELDGKKTKTRQAAIEAVDQYLDKHVSIISADVETGLAAKETYANLQDKATAEHGLIIGAAVSIAGSLIGYNSKGAAQTILGPGLAATAVKATIAGGIGAARAARITHNRQGRENIKDALSGKTVNNEGIKGRHKVYGYKEEIIDKAEDILGDNGEIDSQEQFDNAAKLIAKYRTLDDLQRKYKIQLIGLGSDENIENNKSDVSDSLGQLKQAMANSKYVQNGDIEQSIELAKKDISGEITDEVKRVKKEQVVQRFFSGLKGFAQTAFKAAAISEAINLGHNVIDGESADSSDTTTNDASATETTDNAETATANDASTTEVTDNAETEEIKHFSAKDATNTYELNKYLDDPVYEDVVNYSNISFDSSHGTVIGEPELYDDGYHIPVSNAPKGSEFIVGLEDGQALSAEIITEDGDSYALLKTNTAIFNTVQSDEVTGDWFSVGTENDGTFTSYASMQCTEPFDDEIVVKNPDFVKEISEQSTNNANEAVANTVTEYGSVEFKDGDTANLEIVYGGYDKTADPFWSSEGANFGEPIEADTPEEALSEWVENIQKSPDQLVWNSMAMAGFEKSPEVETFFTENFGENWRADFNIEGEIDTEEEVNIIANKIAEEPEIYEGYKELFLKEFTDKVKNGSVETEQISAGGRYTNLRQANQYINSKSDITNSIIRAAKSNTGGTGLVIHDAAGNSIFDEEKMSKMLKIPDGQNVSETMIRMECGGQTTKVMESYGNAGTAPSSSSSSSDTPTPTSGPTPTIEPTITPTPTIEPTVEPTVTPSPTIAPKDYDNMEKVDDQIKQDDANDIGTGEIKITPTDEVSNDDLTEKPGSDAYEGTEPEIVPNQPSGNAEDITDQVSEDNDYSNNNGPANDGYKPVQNNTDTQDSADSGHANDKPVSADEAGF